MFEDQFSGELSEEQVFFRQLLMITGLASRIYLDTSTEWQVNVRNYMEAINNFEATAIRHLDAEYSEKLKILIKHSREKLLTYRKENPNKSATNIGKEYEIALTMYFARRKLALLMKTLDSKDVFTAKTYRAIDQPTQNEVNSAQGIAAEPDIPVQLPQTQQQQAHYQPPQRQQPRQGGQELTDTSVGLVE